MRLRALLASPLRVSRVGDLGAGDGADEDALADGLVDLEARLARVLGLARGVVYAVPRVRADVHQLPDEVVFGLALLARPQRVGDDLACGWAVEESL